MSRRRCGPRPARVPGGRPATATRTTGSASRERERSGQRRPDVGGELPFVNTAVGRRASLMVEASRTLRTLEVHITTLNPGAQSHPPHRHVNEEVVVLREGVLDVYVNGEIKRVGPGSVMVFLSNDWHSVNNVGDTPATYHVINFYPKNP